MQNSSDQSTFRRKISNESRRFQPFLETLEGVTGATPVQALPERVVAELKTIFFNSVLSSLVPCEWWSTVLKRYSVPHRPVWAHVEVAVEDLELNSDSVELFGWMMNGSGCLAGTQRNQREDRSRAGTFTEDESHALRRD